MQMPFTAEDLVLAANNERSEYEAITFAVRHLRRTIDATAARVAKANAEWHDVPEAEDHADYHAPAEVQFPRAVRDEAVKQLVAYYLGEITLAERSAS
jgi:hypothetical protein